MLYIQQNVSFKFGGLHLVGLDEHVLTDSFDSVEFLCVVQFGQVHLAECAFSED